MTQSRLDKLTASLPTSGLDAVVLNPGPTLKYLTGLSFHLMERPVVLMVTPGRDPVIVLPELELAKVRLFPYKVEAFAYGENPSEWDNAFRNAAGSLGLDGRRIGVEPRQMRLLEFSYVKAGAPEADFPDASDVLAALRVKKDKEEVDAMRHALGFDQPIYVQFWNFATRAIVGDLPGTCRRQSDLNLPIQLDSPICWNATQRQ